MRALQIPYEACVALAECLQLAPLTADWSTAPRGTDPRYAPTPPTGRERLPHRNRGNRQPERPA